MDRPESKPASRYLTNEEAAAYLKLSPHTLNKKRVIGGGPKFRKLGSRVVYAIDDLETRIEARACNTTANPRYPQAR